jgi:hydroxymethylbilane synthase
VLPQVGQGAIALECAADDGATTALLGLVDHAPSRRAVTSERAMLRTLGASCVLPVGGWATADGDELHLRAMVATADGRVVVHADGRGGDPEALGASVATTLLGLADADSVVDVGVVGDGHGHPRP